MKLTYFNVQRFCVYDGPGIRTTLFLKGCPLRCLWCHNPESNEISPQLMFAADKCTLCGRCFDICDARRFDPEEKRIIIDREKCTACGKCAQVCFAGANSICGKTDEAAEIFKTLVRDRDFYRTSGGGTTVSGGEPSMQPEGTLEILEMSKKEGIDSAIETCGCGSEDFYKKANSLGALFLYDIKGVNPEKHKANTGFEFERIKNNLDMLISEKADIILRLPLIPGFNDGEEDLSLLSDFIKERKENIRHAEIMPYHVLGVHKRKKLDVPNYVECENATKEQKERWKSELEESGAEIKISGN